MGESVSWNEIVGPLVARCRVSSSLGYEAVWNAEGAKALGAILQRMADIIDDEIDRRGAAEHATLPSTAEPS